LPGPRSSARTGRSDDGVDATCSQLAHRGQDVADDTVRHPAASGVGDSHDALGRSTQDDRQAVGDEDADRQPGRRGDHTIRRGRSASPRAVGDHDRRAVHLLGEEQAPGVDAHRAGER